MPYIFTWFTLQRGYSRRARAVAFIWLGAVFVILAADRKDTTRVSSTQSPAGVASPSSSEHLVAAVPSPTPTPAPAALRKELGESYRGMVAATNRHLNFIEYKYTKTKGGYALWATHDFFTQYTFSSGDEAKLVSQWIDLHYDNLKGAGVRRVGVMGTGSYASSVWFEVK
jgi:hypothetical protein